MSEPIADPLESAIEQARRTAVHGRERIHVIESEDGGYELETVARYKQLQRQEPVVATAIPDGTVRR